MTMSQGQTAEDIATGLVNALKAHIATHGKPPEFAEIRDQVKVKPEYIDALVHCVGTLLTELTSAQNVSKRISGDAASTEPASNVDKASDGLDPLNKVCPAIKERVECENDNCLFKHPKDCHAAACAGGRQPDCELWHERYPLSQVYAARKEKRLAERRQKLEEDALKYRKLMQHQKRHPPSVRGKKTATPGYQAAKKNANQHLKAKPGPSLPRVSRPRSPWGLGQHHQTTPVAACPPPSMDAFPPLPPPVAPWPQQRTNAPSTLPMPSANTIANIVSQVLAQLTRL
jgi:hypothetical protein